MQIGIVGCGLVGCKRARAVVPKHKIKWAADLRFEAAESLARISPGAKATTDWHEVIADRSVDAVLVSTTHDVLSVIALAAIDSGKHVLLEKPGARSLEELKPLRAAARKKGVTVKVGFNHRFHPALRKAKEIFDSGVLGEPMYVRGRYGHGGRVGYDKEWRAISEISGGGELLDQGLHLIDLSRWFLGDLEVVEGLTATYFWDMEVEDNAFLMLKTPAGQIAWLHASCTEWKNLFSFEVYGRRGKLQVDGLGGSYGVEKLTHYRMLPGMGPPETTIWEYPSADDSWAEEFNEFEKAIIQKREPLGDLADAEAALDIVDKIYAKVPK